MRTLALAALLLLAACNGDAAGPRPAELAGMWHREETQPAGASQLVTHEWLELGMDGGFTWSTEVYGPGGRAADGLVETFSRVGEWAVEGDRLGLRTLSGTGWRVDGGGYQADYVAEWNRRQRVRLEGDRLHVTYFPGREESSTQRTLVFQRVLTLRTLAGR